jgi:hypothetical protein
VTRRIPLIDSSLVFVAENQRLLKEWFEEHEKSKPWPMTWMEIQDMGYRMEKGEYGLVVYGSMIPTDRLFCSPFSTSTSPTTILYHSSSSSLPIYNITHHHHHRSPLHQYIVVVVVVPRSHHRDNPYLFHRPASSRTVTHRHSSFLPSPSLFSLVVIDHHRRSRYPMSLIVTSLSSSPTIVALTVSSLDNPQGETRSDREC